jgi:putative transposase
MTDLDLKRTDAKESIHGGPDHRRAARARGGRKIAELCRRHGITETTFHRWERKYGGLQLSEAKRHKAHEEGNRQLKRLVADQALNLQVVKDLLGKSGDPRAAADGAHAGQDDRRDFGAPRVPLLTGFARTSQRYRPRRAPRTELRARLHTLATQRPRCAIAACTCCCAAKAGG